MKKTLKKFSDFGYKNIFLCLNARFKLSILWVFFNFDSWHVKYNYCCMPYKQKVVNELNNLSFNCLIDLGCSLGDIGNNLNQNTATKKYIGIDRKANVISAAKFLSRRKAKNKFMVGSFELLSSKACKDSQALLLLNFVDRLPTNELVELIMSNISSNLRYLLVDCIKPNSTGKYKFKHSYQKLLDLGLPFKLIKIKNLDKNRDLLILDRLS